MPKIDESVNQWERPKLMTDDDDESLTKAEESTFF